MVMGSVEHGARVREREARQAVEVRAKSFLVMTKPCAPQELDQLISVAEEEKEQQEKEEQVVSRRGYFPRRGFETGAG